MIFMILLARILQIIEYREKKFALAIWQPLKISKDHP